MGKVVVRAEIRQRRRLEVWELCPGVAPTGDASCLHPSGRGSSRAVARKGPTWPARGTGDGASARAEPASIGHPSPTIPLDSAARSTKARFSERVEAFRDDEDARGG